MGDAETVERDLDVAIHLVDLARCLHLVEFLINGVDQLLVVAHVAILTRHQGQVGRSQVVQSQLLYYVVSLIAEADQRIVLSFRQFFHRLAQILDQNGVCFDFLQRVLNRTRHHECDVLPTHIAQAVGCLVGLTVDDLVVQAEYGTRVVRDVLPIGRVDHHGEVCLLVEHVVGHHLPTVRTKFERNAESLHQFLGELYVEASQLVLCVHHLHGGIVDVYTEFQGMILVEAKIIRTYRQGKHQQYEYSC